jgi:GTP cyclohydrolase I
VPAFEENSHKSLSDNSQRNPASFCYNASPQEELSQPLCVAISLHHIALQLTWCCSALLLPRETFMTDNRDMPDVAGIDARNQYDSLDWVGMNAIHLPTRFMDSIQGERAVNASIQAYVNLDNATARGIHMSRLYLQLTSALANQPLTQATLTETLKGFLSSHQELSSRAFVELRFDYLTERPALKSDHAGWKSYATRLSAHWENDEPVIELAVEVLYSSTCPCSAALARQLIQQAFAEKFGRDAKIDATQAIDFLGSTEGIVATPHSQRSVAQVKVKLGAKGNSFPLTQLIDQIENALKTVVQTAVKREDEQEFARLNGENLMFCEDAARRVKSALDADPGYLDYWLRVNHLESLHAHDAVAIVTKQVKGGYLPLPGSGVSA